MCKPFLWRSIGCVSYGVFTIFLLFWCKSEEGFNESWVLLLTISFYVRTLSECRGPFNLSGLWSQWPVMSRRRVGWDTRRRRRTAVGGRRGRGSPAPPPSCWPRRSASLRSRSRLSFLWIRIRARICKRLWNPGIDSEEPTPPAFVAWRGGTTNKVDVPASQAGNRFLSSLKGLQICRVGIKKPTQKNPPKKPQKNPPKKTHYKWVFWVSLFFFKFLIFYENNTNFSLSNRFFMNK